MNSGNTVGVGTFAPSFFTRNRDPLNLGWSQNTVGNGKRSSSATAYLAPNILARPNLDVALESQVTKVISTKKVKNVPLFNTVEFAKNANGENNFQPH